MAEQLKGRRVAVLATDGVERVELIEPRKALDRAGARTVLIAPKQGSIRTWEHDKWGETLEVDLLLREANPDDFDALLLPGGVINADTLRTEPKAVEFVRAFANEGKPMAVICHAAWLLVEADVVRARTLTSWPSLRTDLRNAGANWVDEPVVTQNGLVTSRKPADIPAFNRKMLEEFAEGVHAAHGGNGGRGRRSWEVE